VAYLARFVPGRIIQTEPYWLIMESSSGTMGFGPQQDTLWTESISFPPMLFPLDSVFPVLDVISNQYYPVGLNDTLHGIKVGLRWQGGGGYPTGFSLLPTYNRILYFQLNKSGIVHYGKLSVYSHLVYQSPPPYVAEGPHRELQSIVIAYTLSSSNDLNSGPVSLQPMRATTSNVGAKTLVWSDKHGVMIRDSRGGLYNLRGARLNSRSLVVRPQD
jgi:hypothetical protein